ncbi:MAG TPA: DUF2783 domain-containing protein [Casimicrobiaceae bacterium]|nr:DUF2783 domain-containing protein [Casimicrobiaceae bacterium]
MPLNVEPNITAPDEFYEALIDAHRGLTTQQSQALNARLILLLANQIGDVGVLHEALGHARQGIERAPPGKTDSPSQPKGN